MIEPQRPAADRRHVIHRMRTEKNRFAVLLKLADTVDALLLKMTIADCERLVNHENVGIDIDGDGKRQTHVHAGRIRLHGPVKKCSELGKLQNRRKLAFHFRWR